MFIYIAIAVLIFVVSFCYSNTRNKYLSVELKFLCFLLLFVPAAVRLNIGTDYQSYVSIFNRVRAGREIYQEFGWMLINLFVARAKLHYQWVFVISSFLTYVFLFFTKKKDAWIVLVVYFLYLYTTSYNAVRNAISIAMFWYSYCCLCRGKRLRGFVFVLLSTLFHISACIYIPIYMAMCFVRMNKRVTICIAVVCYILFARLHFAQRILEAPVLAMSKYAHYVTSAKYSAAVKMNSGLGVLLRHFYLFLMYCLCDEKRCPQKEFSSISILFLSLLFTDILSTQIFIFYRLRDCFIVAYMAMFSCLFRYRSRNALYEVGKIFCLLYAIVMVFVLGLLKNINEIVPYTSILGG